jgi:hypothetical protein
VHKIEGVGFCSFLCEDLVGEGAAVAETLLFVDGEGVALDPEVMLQPRLVPQQVLTAQFKGTVA